MLSPRAIAHKILLHIEQESGYPDRLLQSYLDRYDNLDPRDKGLITELVFGVLRWQGRLDSIISRFSSVKLKKINPVVRIILRTAIYQILFLDKIPARAAVNEAVKLARESQPDYVVRFVNAVLRKVSDNIESLKKVDETNLTASGIAEIYSHPKWIVDAWVKELGTEETAELCRANNKTPPTSIRVNTLLTTSENLAEELRRAGIEVQPCKYAPDALEVKKGHFNLQRLEAYEKGLFQIQDEASQLVAHILTPRPEERILDACAGFGGKTSIFAQLMENSGEIMAVDLSPWKVAALEENLERLKIGIVGTLQTDVRKLNEMNIKPFDRIFLDAPCSGLGVLRRKPDIKWKRRPGDVYRLSLLQRDLLDSLASLLRVGGVLVYATCTLLNIENSEVIESFLQNHPEFCIEPISDTIPWMKVFARGPYFCSFPHRHGTDGFFAARLKRIK
ncbi:MAG: 16S rRNA (cytosine(967)-C(5))-methyltransferase RsmB [Deltaproteobacteria bacterium]|nr:MAG: 16S rRNA (cytosine(967)-C(5))-methyltransferase RsmB [Deltaproteobacteria bacterium]